MPRLIDQGHCPHCNAKLPAEEELTPVCPECGGSLQQRFLKAGCFSSAPLWLLTIWLFERLA